MKTRLARSQMKDVMGATHPIQEGTQHVIKNGRCYEGTGNLPGPEKNYLPGDCHSSGFNSRSGGNKNWSIWT